VSLIPAIKIEKLQGLNEAELKATRSSEIVNEDGNYIATLIVPTMAGGATIYDHTRTQAEYLGVQGNSVFPPEKEANPLECPICGFVAKNEFGLMAHKRKHK